MSSKVKQLATILKIKLPIYHVKQVYEELLRL